MPAEADACIHTTPQENLEKFTEHLSWLAEQPLDEFKGEAKRSEVVNYTRVTETFLKNLLKSVEDGLGEEEEEVVVSSRSRRVGIHHGGVLHELITTVCQSTPTPTRIRRRPWQRQRRPAAARA